MKKVISVFLLCMLMVTLVSCGSTKDQFLGTWKNLDLQSSKLSQMTLSEGNMTIIDSEGECWTEQDNMQIFDEKMTAGGGETSYEGVISDGTLKLTIKNKYGEEESYFFEK